MLPIKTTAEDVINLVDYLKTKATGATVSEAKATVGNTLVDGRKLTAYEAWGILARDGERLRLTERGRELSRSSEDKTAHIFRDILRESTAYRMALEWMFHQRFQSVTNIEVAAHWHDHFSDELGTASEATIRDQVLCFFSLSQAGGLGAYIVGRRGNPTRFEPTGDALGQFIGESGLVATENERDDPILQQGDLDVTGPLAGAQSVIDLGSRFELKSGPPRDFVRVFISHSKNMAIVDQVKTILEMGDFDFEVAEEEETTAIPIPDKVFGAMRSCNAAVICVTADDQEQVENGTHRINQNVLIEIGAAFVLYDKKVILVWDKRLTVPSNLQGLYRSEFDGDELSWPEGIKLMRGVSNFRKSDEARQ